MIKILKTQKRALARMGISPICNVHARSSVENTSPHLYSPLPEGVSQPLWNVHARFCQFKDLHSISPFLYEHEEGVGKLLVATGEIPRTRKGYQWPKWPQIPLKT